MKLLYKKEHLTCIHYDSGNKPQVEIRRIYKGHPFDEHSHQCKIIFILEGSAVYRMRGLTLAELHEGQILLNEPDKRFSISTKDSAKLLIICLTEITGLCECFPLENLLSHKDESHSDSDITVLEANAAIDAFIEGLTENLKQGLRCKYFLETKTKELFYLFRAYYDKEKLAQFFGGILYADAHFYYFIKQNYQNINSVSEFSKMLDMKQIAFEKKFKEIFGMPPYKWIIEQRSRDIHRALCTENTPLKELTARFGFSSKSSFSDFVKKNLGAPPGRIRGNVRLDADASESELDDDES